ncbi:MAG: Arc family DNA-binding protein [Mesorhizobium sp.]|uniref:Arc family DNA-binding protein n=1 Tax=Mesorhizobium sp. TaxID=1871066 RepID=UPI00121AD07E|nr:Arc family DNA-binding protein [Mesorhizobium sp.]TIP70359.1 MAG: Arc family DNA-binding protein [Mesorhizobium sp.]TIQ06782.1 MAG: Arc family DNA-binding protein [Mesorhizobium sp.]TIR48656.1 MAG: Arc family DNA-binding protein [Mesorhizobium sp.]TJV94707.1 MAG: Arc family DNA-binding protein [Mesorhizobium sp.]
MPSHDDPSFHLRVPPPLRKLIKLSAAANERSMTEEILARLERSFSSDDEVRSRAVKLLTEALSILDKGKG